MSLPPGPNLPETHLHKIYYKNPYSFLLQCQQDYGDIFTLNMGTFNNNQFNATGKWVFLARPYLFKQMFLANSHLLKAGEANALMFGYTLPRHGLLGIDGCPHKARRKKILTPFLPDYINTHIPMIVNITKKHISQWPLQAPFSLYYKMQYITIDIIISILFGVEVNAAFKHKLSEIIKFEQIQTPQTEIEKIFNNIKKLLLKHIKEQSKQPSNQTNSILNILLTQKNNDANELNEEIICDELLTLLEAGFGTTAIMLSWTLFYILSTPKVYQKLTEELLLVLDDGSISSYNISDLIYLEAVIKEALRIQTIIPTTGVRLVQDDFFIGGYTLPKGTMLACCSYLVHINPEYYSNPNSFKPERFLGKKPLPYHWNPFGGGSRRCIGIHLAELEIKLIITTVLTHINLNLTNHNTTPFYENVFFAPKGGPQVIIT